MTIYFTTVTRNSTTRFAYVNTVQHQQNVVSIHVQQTLGINSFPFCHTNVVVVSGVVYLKDIIDF